MRNNIRRWFADNPRAADFAFGLVLAGTYAFEMGAMDAAGGNTGP